MSIRKRLSGYYDPKLSDEAHNTVPNGLLRELKEKELRERDYSLTRVEDMGVTAMTDEELANYLHLTPDEAAIVIPKLTPERRAVYDRMASLDRDISLAERTRYETGKCFDGFSAKGIPMTDKTRLSPRDYFPVEHVAPHELGANCRVVPMAVLVEWADRFDKLAIRDAAEGCCEGLAPQSECRCEQERKAAGHPPYHRSATPKPAPDAVRDQRVMALAEKIRTADVQQLGAERYAIINLLIPEHEMEDFCTALSASVPSPDGARRWQHKKRGTEYVEIGRGLLQVMDHTDLTDNDELVAYRGDDGRLWFRSPEEMEDGRFEALPPISHRGRAGSATSGRLSPK